ncbi:MAG: hypothetical protein BWZ08_00265 [candidate division BRC1 bacterium ADurb.BinA292]|nr:MAG: hypothetical protein BWZ08_00265 [candidate division BRC1 bacterium ADurb.BinA292]
MKIFTIGFTRKSAREFFGLIRDSQARRLVDVRLHNVSQLAGFAKKDDLAWFVREICGIDYVHLPELAPTEEILEAYRKNKRDWKTFEARFLALMKARKIEETVPKKVLAEGCLVCSEDKPEHCHRRFVAEYLQAHWGNVEIIHLG